MEEMSDHESVINLTVDSSVLLVAGGVQYTGSAIAVIICSLTGEFAIITVAPIISAGDCSTGITSPFICNGDYSVGAPVGSSPSLFGSRSRPIASSDQLSVPDVLSASSSSSASSTRTPATTRKGDCSPEVSG